MHCKIMHLFYFHQKMNALFCKKNKIGIRYYLTIDVELLMKNQKYLMIRKYI
jgi:hypothetical protein